MFKDDDTGFLGWIAAHPDGYVLNLARSGVNGQPTLHRAACRRFVGDPPNGTQWTHSAAKHCSLDASDLGWLNANRCAGCLP